MATSRLVLVDHDTTNAGAWYHVAVTTSGISPTYRMPVQPILNIGTSISGLGYLDFSISSPIMLETDTALFERWDGIAQINPAVTGFRVVSISGLVTANVMLKTLHAS